MGWNSSMVIMHDALHEIKRDKEFGAKVYDACLKVSTNNGLKIDISCFGHVNAATVLESHHADNNRVLIIGGNNGVVTDAVVYAAGYISENDLKLKALKKFANELGYRVVEKK